MTESMVSAGHYNALKLERDQLAARTKELEEFISGFCGKGYSISGYHLNGELELFDLFVSDEGILDATPEPSLLIHDAELMESEAKVWLRDGNATSMYSGRNVNHVLSVRARELREEAEGKG